MVIDPDDKKRIYMKCILVLFIAMATSLAAIKILHFTYKYVHPLAKRIFIPLFRWAKYYLNAVSVSTLLLTVFVLVTWFLGGIVHYRSQESNWEDAVFHGIQTVFCVMEGDSRGFRAAFPNHPIETFVLCAAVPVLTASTVILFLVNFFPKPFPRAKEFFIFSQVDERSIMLAEDLFQEHHDEKICIIFLRATWGELKVEAANRLKKIRARVYPYIESELMEIHFRMKNKMLRFFFISADTDENFKRMRLLIEEADEKTLFQKPRRLTTEQILEEEQRSVFRQEIYLLSETASAPLLIDHLRLKLCEPEKCKLHEMKRKDVFAHTDLRLLDRYRTVTYHLLSEKPLYETADNKSIRVLVLGFGRVGQEFFRAAASFCTMDGYRTSFCLCDQEMNQHWEKLILQYPECDRGVCVSRKTIDVESRDLLRLLKRKIKAGTPFTYIVLSLGDDERNIRVATKLKRYYRQLYWQDQTTHQPTICVNLENAIKSEYVKYSLKDEYSMSKGLSQIPDIPLNAFGSDHDTFSEDMLMHRGLWAAARKLHVKLKLHDLAYWREYERRSSIACAAHAYYHVKSMSEASGKCGSIDLYEKLSKDKKDDLIDSEHRRWMHYSRCDGMQGVSLEIANRYKDKLGNHVDSVAKLTPCLIPTKDLDMLYKGLYPEDTAMMHAFIKRDELVVRNATRLCKIIEDPYTVVALIDEGSNTVHSASD